MVTWTPVTTGTGSYTDVAIIGAWFTGDGWFVAGHFGMQVWGPSSTATNTWTEV